MPRRLRLRVAGLPFHVIQRGNNRSDCFFRRTDYLRYRDELTSLAVQHRVAVHAYVLMTNHVHLLMTPQESDAIARLMKALGQRYAQYVNRTRERTGPLWDGRYRSCPVDSDAYLLTCQRYIECNPVRAGMVRHPGAYPWSSYRANAMGVPDGLVSPHPLMDSLGATAEERRRAYVELFTRELGERQLAAIRSRTNGGFALGNEAFQARLALDLGRRVAPARRLPELRT